MKIYRSVSAHLDFEHDARQNSFIPPVATEPTPSHEQELEALIEEARRRARRRRLGYLVVLSLAGAAGLALALGGGGGGGGGGGTVPGPPPSSGPEGFAAHGLKVKLEPGWRPADRILTPKLVSPSERFSVGTFPMRPARSDCLQFPGTAYNDMRPSDGIITIMERGSNHGGFPPRPAEFNLNFRRELAVCTPPAVDSQVFIFRDAGRNLQAYVVLGSRGPKTEAESILNSLTASPRT